MANDLQKEFHVILKSGTEGAILYLLENFERNKKFTIYNLRMLCTNERVNEAKAAVRIVKRDINDTSWLWATYEEFRKLSERQKTKRGGFKAFARAKAGEETALFGRIENLCDRKFAPTDSPEGGWYITVRPNYKWIFEGYQIRMQKMTRRLEVLRRGINFVVQHQHE